MKPVLVTGATGFLGTHLVTQLRARAIPVRVLCRSRSAYDDQAEIEIARGDVTSAADVEQAMVGAEAVYHLAGFVSRNPADSDILHRVHVEGTRNVLESSLRCGARRVVVASSSGTIAVSRKPIPHDEWSLYKEKEVAGWPYYVSKIEEEKVAFEFHHEHRLDVVVINPSLLLGPGDERESSTGDIVAFLEGQIFSYPTGGMSFVDARDCAAGVINAMEKGRAGERYLLGGENWTFRRFIQEVARIAGRRPPMMSSPTWLSLAMAPLLRKIMPAIGAKFDLDAITIQMAGMFWYCDSSKARRELGFTTRDPIETLRDTVADIRRRKGIP